MKKTLSILVETEDGVEIITITDNAGNSVDLSGVMIIGSCFRQQHFYMAGAGDHREVAFAFGEGISKGVSFAGITGDSWYVDFYHRLLMEMARRTGTHNHEEANPQNILDRWEKEDGKKKWH